MMIYGAGTLLLQGIMSFWRGLSHLQGACRYHSYQSSISLTVTIAKRGPEFVFLALNILRSAFPLLQLCKGHHLHHCLYTIAFKILGLFLSDCMVPFYFTMADYMFYIFMQYVTLASLHEVLALYLCRMSRSCHTVWS